MRTPWRYPRWLAFAAVLSYGALAAQAEDVNLVERMKQLALPTLSGAVPSYYSEGNREHAARLQSAIEDMNVFYQKRLGVQAHVTLALLDAKDWNRVTGEEYSLPRVEGDPLVILMPATSDNPIYGLIGARKEAVPPNELQAFLRDHHTTFSSVAETFVDLIGFHELGHTLNTQFGIDSKDLWLNEFLANYWSYAYISERQTEWKIVFGLLGRPSKTRPKNTSLEDFERLYDTVDDYGWYQGMFESRVREIYPRFGLKFLTDLKQMFPLAARGTMLPDVAARMKPAELLERLETIAPGFQKWTEAFSPTQQAMPTR